MSGFVFRKLIINKQDLRTVLELPTLSDGAKALYAYMFTLPNSYYLNNEEMVEQNICASIQMVNKFKRELKAAELYYENKDGYSNIKFAYLGSMNMKAHVFAKQWIRKEI